MKLTARMLNPDNSTSHEFKLLTLDWCAAMKGKKYSNFLIKLGLTMMKRLIPQFVRECPYPIGEYKVVNAFIPRKSLVAFPTFRAEGNGKIFEGKMLLANGSGAIEVFE